MKRCATVLLCSIPNIFSLPLAIILVFLGCSLEGHAATLDTPATFGDGGAPDTEGWSGSAVADAGEVGVGDHALEHVRQPGQSFHTLTKTNAIFLG